MSKMKTKEYEVKIVNEDMKKMRNAVRKMGSTRVHGPICMRRCVFYHCKSKINGFVRIREEYGNVVKITCKQFGRGKYATEHELVSNKNYEDTVDFFVQCGLVKKSEIETTREKWIHKDANEIVFDTWPGIPEYMEVECKDEDRLHKIMDRLNVPRQNIMYSGVDTLYREYYGLSKHRINNKTPVLRYETVQSDLGIKRGNKGYKKIRELSKIYQTKKRHYQCGHKFRQTRKKRN